MELQRHQQRRISFVHRLRTPSQRMLSDIVHDTKLTYRIHALFVWLLRTGKFSN